MSIIYEINCKFFENIICQKTPKIKIVHYDYVPKISFKICATCTMRRNFKIIRTRKYKPLEFIDFNAPKTSKKFFIHILFWFYKSDYIQKIFIIFTRLVNAVKKGNLTLITTCVTIIYTNIYAYVYSALVKCAKSPRY